MHIADWSTRHPQSNIACTIINGNIVYRDGRVIGCDEKALVEQANTELVRILEKA